MILTEIYKKTLYLNKDIDALFNCEIREYDLKDAGFNLTKYFNLLPENILETLSKMPKDKRTIELGMLQRKDKDLAKKLSEAFSEARKLFFDANDLEENDILAIKKDAIFVIDKVCSNNQFSNLIFREKNKYLGYMRINKIEFYYKDEKSDLDVKGFNDEVISYHKDYMLDFIKMVFYNKIYLSPKDFIRFLTDFIKLYRSYELEFGYYRQLDLQSYYVIKFDNEWSMIRDLEDDEVEIDITYNYFNFILPIVNLFI